MESGMHAAIIENSVLLSCKEEALPFTWLLGYDLKLVMGQPFTSGHLEANEFKPVKNCILQGANAKGYLYAVLQL